MFVRNWNGSALDTLFTVYTNGDTVAAGNVTAYSDRRMKENVHGLTIDLSGLRAVRYTRKDTDQDEVGVIAQEVQKVIAQEVQKVIPEVVKIDEHGYLSVDYGRLGTVVALQVQKKVEELEHRLMLLEGR